MLHTAVKISCCLLILTSIYQECSIAAKAAVILSEDSAVVEPEVKRFAEDRKLAVVDTNGLVSHRSKRDNNNDTNVCEMVWMQYIRQLGEVDRQTAKVDDIQNRITTLKEAYEMEKIDTCREYIAGFGDPQRVNGRSTLMGSFMNDLAPGRDEIWVSDGCCETKVFLEFKTLSDFSSNNVYRTHQLQTPCDGTGHVIYDATLYCNKKNSNTIMKYNFVNKTIDAELTLPYAGFRNTFPYQFYGYSDMDFAVDEQGLWVIYSTQQNNGNMVLSRLAINNLTILSTFETNFKKNRVGNTFMACGVLYATSSYVDSPTYIIYRFDTNDGSERFMNEGEIKLRRYDKGNGRTSTFMLDYNPKNRQLYAWTHMNQITYQVLRKF